MRNTKLFGVGHKRQRVQGLIGYFGLQDWWYGAFSDQERDYIRRLYQPMGAREDPLTTGTILHTTQTLVGFLHSLAGWFAKEQDRPIAYRILQKAQECVDASTPVLDVHFLYQELITICYRDRDKPGYLEQAMAACHQQIALSPQAAKAFRAEFPGRPLPRHKGYEQLAIILEKQQNYEATIQLCQQAASRGWAGDWEKRIQRCRRRALKA